MKELNINQRVQEIYSKMYDKWVNENKKYIMNASTTIYVPRANASVYSENRYDEVEWYITYDIPSMKEYMEDFWMEEIGEQGVIDYEFDENDIYSDSNFLFNSVYEDWLKETIEEKERRVMEYRYEHEY